MTGEDWVLRSFLALLSPHLCHIREIREKSVRGREGDRALEFPGQPLDAGTQTSPGNLLAGPDPQRFACVAAGNIPAFN